MIKKYTILLLSFLFFILLKNNSFSQGFDWQYSLRLPYEPPNFFIGVNSRVNQYFHTGEFGFLEQKIVCCNFSDGRGLGAAFGIALQYWWSASQAWEIQMNYSNLDGVFNTRVEYPRTDYILVTEYGYITSINYIDLNMYYKNRITLGKMYVSAGFALSIFLNQKYTLEENKISPPEDPFQSRIIEEGNIPDLNSFYILPQLKIGYDINLGKEKFASPELILGFPIMNRISTESWKTYIISGGISIYWGI